MKKHNLKGTDTVILQLSLSVAEARALRDHLYLEIAVYHEDESYHSWSFPVGVSFDRYVEWHSDKKINSVRVPAMVKLHDSLRTALRLPPMYSDYSTFGYTARKRFVKTSEARSLFRQWIEEMLSVYALACTVGGDPIEAMHVISSIEKTVTGLKHTNEGWTFFGKLPDQKLTLVEMLLAKFDADPKLEWMIT